jgi:tetratricopeptide (TPR) repeat protein
MRRPVPKRRRAVSVALLGAFLSIALVSGPDRAFASATAKVASTVTFEEASRYYQAKDWSNASAAFTWIVKREPQNGRAWYRLGVSQQNLSDYVRAIESYRRAESIGHNPSVMYNLACAFSLWGKPDSAFAWLGRTVDAGYRQPDLLQADADLAPLHADARFASVVERVKRNATPCAFSPEARQFDFWVGSWDVRTAQGDLAGTNDIRLGAGECVLVENWKSTQGGLGQSLNFYDADAKLWRQIWVDADAEVTRFEGSFTEGQMRFKGERVSKTGERIPVKMTFTPMPDGRVRQMGEVSSDGGESWSVEYDLYYSPARREG